MSDQPDTLITVKEAAKLAQVTIRTIHRWIEKGAVPAKRNPGRRILVPRESVAPK